MYYSRQVLSIFFSLYSPQTIYILENILENIYFFHHTSNKGFTHPPWVDHPPSPDDRADLARSQAFLPGSVGGLDQGSIIPGKSLSKWYFTY